MIDTLDTVKVKIINNLKSFADTLSVLSEDLKSKGFSVMNGSMCKNMILLGVNTIDPEQMILNFVKTSYPLWDDLFSTDPSKVTPNQLKKIEKALPSELSFIINPLLNCKKKDGTTAIDQKIVNLLFSYLKAFVKLGLKVIFFKQEPITYVMIDNMRIYSYKNGTLSDSLGINLNMELHNRKVEGI